MGTDYEGAVASCPTPAYHQTHRYCPSCPWTERGPLEPKPPLPPEVQEVFESFWADIVCPGGVWDLDQVKCELHDYRTCITEVPKVYMEVTGGLLSKPNYLASGVIDAFRERFLEKDQALDDEELECLESLLDILDDEWASTGPAEEGSERPGVLDPT